MSAESEPMEFDGDGDYVERRRQKAIFDARDLARDVIVNAKRQHARDEISPDAARTDVRSVVESYISEVEHIARMAGANELLSETVIHVVSIQPPEPLLQYYRDDTVHVRSPEPSPKRPEGGIIRGLEGFLTAPDVFSAKWTIDADVRHEGPKPITETASTRMPIEASVDAFRFVNAFLREVNLDIEPRLEDYDGGEGPGV